MRRTLIRTGFAVLLALSGAAAAPGAPAHAASRCNQPEPPPTCNSGDPDPGPVDTAPLGAYDTLTFVGNGVRVTGWAADHDSSGPLLVDIWIDDAFAKTLTADAYRPDVAAAYPSFGAYRGFDAVVPSRHGSHTVCAWAINVTPPGASLLPHRGLGCKTYDVPVATNIQSYFDHSTQQWMVAFDDNVLGETSFQVRWDYYVVQTLPGSSIRVYDPRTQTFTLSAHDGTGRVSLPLWRPEHATMLTITAPGFGSASTTALYL
ncbi:hypothetical protein AB0M46_04480 [Dactylosporangium sp. NPDC051485]|uniref:hypothetical protein n=1 Tax=Dactylosporangium sp. NPDC051485 TaxID=3154846 RepID=UPI0034351F51